MSDNLPVESVPPTLSGPDAPKYPPVSPGVLVDLALIESLDLTDAADRAASAERAAAVIADAEARAARLIAAAIADAEEQVADVKPLADAAAEKIIQEAKDEAAALLADAEQAADKLLADAEQTLTTARDSATEITVDAEAEATRRLKALDVDRQLSQERTTEAEERGAAAAKMSQEAATVLRDAHTEAERLTVEAGEAVDRMMRSGQVVADAQREAFSTDAESVTALQTEHVISLRELTDRYEAKVSNQNIENLELRQEITDLRESFAVAKAVKPVPPTADALSSADPIDADDAPADDVVASDSDPEALTTHTEDFASQWMIPDDPEPDTSPAVDFDETPADPLESPPKLGKSTGLAPNARLVEPLKASAFRPTDDGSKKRRRRKR